MQTGERELGSFHTDPVNGIQIARNIAAGLKRIDPEHGSIYDANLAAFEQRLLVRLYGQQLVDMLGGETILQLARGYEFWTIDAGPPTANLR